MSERKSFFTVMKDFFVKPKGTPELPTAEQAIISKDAMHQLANDFMQSDDKSRTYTLPEGHTLLIERWPQDENVYRNCYLLDQEGNKIDLDFISTGDFGSYESIYKAAYEEPEMHKLKSKPGLVESILNEAVATQEVKYLPLQDGSKLEFMPVTLEDDLLRYQTAKITFVDKFGNRDSTLFEEILRPGRSMDELFTLGSVQNTQTFVENCYNRIFKDRNDLDDYIASKSNNIEAQKQFEFPKEYKKEEVAI